MRARLFSSQRATLHVMSVTHIPPQHGVRLLGFWLWLSAPGQNTTPLAGTAAGSGRHPRSRIGQERSHLAILNLAQCTAVLLVPSHRAGALLGNPWFIQHHNAPWVPKALDDHLLQPIMGGLGISEDTRQQALHVVGRAILGHLGQLPGGFALQSGE
jgi:hypothetical protein